MASSIPNPRIRIRTAVPADADAVIDIHHAAFGLDIMHQLIYTQGVSDYARQKSKEVFFPSAEGQDPAKPKKKGELILMVAELLPAEEASEAAPAAPPEIVGYSRWLVHREPRTEEEWNVKEDVTVESRNDGYNIELHQAFLAALYEKRRKWARGDPVLFLTHLACSPKYHRLGAGSALMRWGVDLADREKLPAMIESTPMGHPLYRKFGFKDIDVVDMPVTERWGAVRPSDRSWGAGIGVDVAGPAPEGVFRTVIMRRLAPIQQ